MAGLSQRAAIGWRNWAGRHVTLGKQIILGPKQDTFSVGVKPLVV
jgi:hypothetical protein